MDPIGQILPSDVSTNFPFGPSVSWYDSESQAVINDYDPIADVFDEVMAYDFHAVTHPLRSRIASQLSRGDALRCFDVCCGSGLFFELLSKDFEIAGHGIDLSKRQIEVARARDAVSQRHNTYQIGDVVGIDFPHENDLITINFDALNHLRSRELWKHILDKSLKSLNATGKLLFDVNLPERLAHDWTSPEVIVKKNVTYIQVAHNPVIRNDSVLRRTVMMAFRRLNSGEFTRTHAEVEQFALPIDEIVRLLKQCGFHNVEMVSTVGRNPIGHVFNKNRAFLCAQK
jgi:SAM-dependent methyltransferase